MINRFKFKRDRVFVFFVLSFMMTLLVMNFVAGGDYGEKIAKFEDILSEINDLETIQEPAEPEAPIEPAEPEAQPETQPEPETQPQAESFASKFKEEIKEDEPCDGCEIDGFCLRTGARGKDDYCSSTGKIVPQLDDGSECENNFECKGASCKDSVCFKAGFFRRILNWFKGIFN